MFGQATLINGTVYFSSFSPEFISTACGISPVGQGWLYAINIHNGINKLPQTKTSMGARVPDDVAVHSGLNEKNQSVIRIIGAGQGEVLTFVDQNTNDPYDVNSGTIDTGQRIEHRRIYSFFEER